MRKLITLILIIISSQNLIAQQVTNIRVSQEGDEVVITYDLSGGSAGETFNMEVTASENRGQSFLIIPKSLRGDLNNISPGTDKKIVWNVLNDREELTGEGFVFRLKAVSRIPIDSYSGTQGFGISYSLAGRTATSTPKPNYTGREEGIVVTSITVDKNGNVTAATAGARGSTTMNPELLNAARGAALNSKFNTDKNAPAFQTGTITYRFIIGQ